MNPDRVHLPDFRLLTWRDVDPAARPDFDPAAVAVLVTAENLPAQDADWRLRDLWLEGVSIGFADRFDRFLEAAGIAPSEHQRLLDHAIGGRFASWTEPDRNLITSVAELLAGQAVDA